MNILFLVIAYLMLISIITYGRIQTLVGTILMQKEFKEAMEKKEPIEYSEQSIKRYVETHIPSSDPPEQGGATTRNPASPKISFNLLLSKSERDKNPQMLAGSIQMAKNLLEYLYSGQRFYQEAELLRPDLANEIIQALLRVSEREDKPQRWDIAKEIANVDLADPILNKAFTKMLEGTVKKIRLNRNDYNRIYLPVSGVLSLLDLIEVKPNKLQVRIFLASPQVLMALFERPDVVAQILQSRRRIYNDLVQGNGKESELADFFKQQFSGMIAPGIPPDLLNWGVSKTNPAGYQ